MLGDLTFRSRQGDHAVTVVDGGVCLRGEVEWIVQGNAHDVLRVRDSVGSAAHDIAPGVVLLKFGNAVGRFAISGIGVIHVRCGKWGDETFDAMLGELTAIALELPFAADQRASLPHDRSLADQHQILMHAFLYLRSIVLGQDRASSLPFAFESVLRDPHQRFEAERLSVGLEAASRADARTIARLVTAADPLVRTSRAVAGANRIAVALRGHLPLTIDAPNPTRTFDTAENRFAKVVLQQASAIVDRVDGLAHRNASSFWRSIAADCAAMQRVLRPIARHALWNDVGPMVHVPIGSSVLQRKHGYKAVLRHHFALRAAARLPVGARELNRLLGIKDVASLYELWTFFKVVEAVTLLLGPPDHVDQPDVTAIQLDIPWSFRASWRSATVSVFYNLSFSRGRDAPYGSSSLMLRPDIVIQRGEGPAAELHVLDAKLRVDVEAAEDEDDDDERSSKRDDIKKMHTYRDALPNVRSAFVLYPGNVSVSYVIPGVMSGGVGAVPLTPGDHAADLARHVAEVLGGLG